MSLAPGTQLDRYVVEAVLGSGGMGTVYRAHDLRLQRTVALKLLEPREDDAQGVIAAAFREAQAAAAVHHPNVAEIFDVYELEDRAFIVMEHVAGASLRAFVGDSSVDVATRVRWLTDVASALAAAHDLGVIHRDVKPENVMVSHTGLTKVLDFGVARAPRAPARGTPIPGAPAEDHLQTLSDGGALVGTPAYIAPEQIRGEPVDVRADQFGWAVLAYELLTGSLPWTRRGPAFAVLMAILRDAPEPFAPASGVPPEVAAVVLRALAKSPASRFDAKGDIVTALPPLAPPPPRANGADPGAPDAPRSAPPPPSPPPPPPSAPPAPPVHLAGSAPAASDPSTSAFHDPDFAAPVDLDGHLALLPPRATGKGMFFAALLALGARMRPGLDLCTLASVPLRRYIPFRDYPMDEYLRLEVTTAGAVYRGVPLGEGMRRLGWTALDSLLGSHVGKTVFGILGRDVELLLLHTPKIYDLTLNFGRVFAEKVSRGRFLVHASGMPIFLETYHVGVFEGALRHCRVPGRVRIAASGLEDATFEVTLR